VSFSKSEASRFSVCFLEEGTCRRKEHVRSVFLSHTESDIIARELLVEHTFPEIVCTNKRNV
jgi:hypothetical protein